MKTFPPLLLVLCLLLTGCGKPKIDTSTDDSMKASIEKVKASLPEDKKAEFEEALKIVVFSNLDLSDLFQQSQLDTGATERSMKEALHGKTGLEIIAMAEDVRKERESERIAKEKEQKAKTAQILLLAEELRKEGDYERALTRYREAAIHDHDNIELQKEIAEVERLIAEKREKEYARKRKVQELISEARKLGQDEDLAKALELYQEALKLDGDSEAASEGVKITSERIKDFKAANAYLPNVELYAFEAKTIDTFLEKGVPAVRFKLKNKGDQTITRLEVTVYFKDAQDKVIKEETFHPVHDSQFSLNDNNKPLKPNYIWELEKGKYYTVENAPTEWKVGNAEAKITGLTLKK